MASGRGRFTAHGRVDPDKLGRGCVWRIEVPDCIHQNHIFRVRFGRSNGYPAASWPRVSATDAHRHLIYDHGKYIYPETDTMQVAKWGNSLAVRLPAAVVEALALKEGDDIEILIADERRFEVRRKPSRAELLERLRAYRGRLPPDFRFDRLEANEGRG